MSNSPKISVIMTCYNHEIFIEEAIESILNQTFQDFELIIVDDGSIDDSLSTIEKYEDSRIVLITQENSGPSVAINNGLRRSKGEFIALMSGDDVAFPHRLKTQISKITQADADIIFSLPKIIGPISEPLRDEICPWFFGQSFKSTAKLFRKLFYYPNFICAPTFFGKRTAIEKVGDFHRGLIQLQDLDYWIRACKSRLRLMLFNEPVIKYRYLYGENLSAKSNINRIKIEQRVVYKRFMDRAPLQLLQEAFSEIFIRDYDANSIDLEIDKALLFLNHSDSFIRSLGAERMINHFEDDEIFKHYLIDRGISTAELFKTIKEIKTDETKDIVGRLWQLSKRILSLIRFFIRGRITFK